MAGALSANPRIVGLGFRTNQPARGVAVTALHPGKDAADRRIGLRALRQASQSSTLG
jgi:hypothetical protein